MSILEELYNGNINPSEKYIKNGGEYQKLNSELTEYIEKLTLSFNNAEKQLFEKVENHFCEVCYISEKERFIEGFRIGAQMMWELCNFKSTNLK